MPTCHNLSCKKSGSLRSSLEAKLRPFILIWVKLLFIPNKQWQFLMGLKVLFEFCHVEKERMCRKTTLFANLLRFLLCSCSFILLRMILSMWMMLHRGIDPKAELFHKLKVCKKQLLSSNSPFPGKRINQNNERKLEKGPQPSCLNSFRVGVSNKCLQGLRVGRIVNDRIENTVENTLPI